MAKTNWGMNDTVKPADLNQIGQEINDTTSKLTNHTGSGGAAHSVATASDAGFMSSTDKTKLDGVQAGANNYSHPTGDGNLHVPATGTGNNGKVLKAGSAAGSAAWGNVAFSEVSGKPTTLSGYGITDAAPSSHVGAGGTAHANATSSVDGFMSAADKGKLDGVQAGANNYTHPSTHPASIIVQDANNRFMTDAERSKLSGIAAGANNYTHPATHPPSIIVQDANNRFMTDDEKAKLGALPAGGNVVPKKIQLANENGGTIFKVYDLASYKNNAATVRGALKITLPVGWTNTMMDLYFNGINYGTNNILQWDMSLFGYNYSQNGTWQRAQARTSGNTMFKRVRLGIENGKCIIIVGEGTDTWEYPAVTIAAGIFSHTVPAAILDEPWKMEIVTSWESAVISADITKLTTGIHAETVGGMRETDFVPNRNILPGSTDLDTIKDPGFYRLGASNPNQPPGTNGYGQLLSVYGGSDTAAQMFFDYVNSSRLHFRSGKPWHSTDPSWGPWRRILTDNMMGAGGGIDADTVRSFIIGQHLRTTDMVTFKELVLREGGGQIYPPAAPTGNWSRGWLYKAQDGSNIAAIGMLGNNKGEPVLMHLAYGVTPWDSGRGLYILANGNVGVRTTTPEQAFDVNGWARAQRFLSTVARGTAPLEVLSDTMVANLNANFVNGKTTDQDLRTSDSVRFSKMESRGGADTLRLYASAVTDHVYLAMYPRSADPTLRGMYFGYGTGGSNQLVMSNELNGNILLNTPNGYGVVSNGKLEGTELIAINGTMGAYKRKIAFASTDTTGRWMLIARIQNKANPNDSTENAMFKGTAIIDSSYGRAGDRQSICQFTFGSRNGVRPAFFTVGDYIPEFRIVRKSDGFRYLYLYQTAYSRRVIFDYYNWDCLEYWTIEDPNSLTGATLLWSSVDSGQNVQDVYVGNQKAVVEGSIPNLQSLNIAANITLDASTTESAIRFDYPGTNSPRVGIYSNPNGNTFGIYDWGNSRGVMTYSQSTNIVTFSSGVNLVGIPTAVTAPTADNSTRLSTTAHTQAAIDAKVGALSGLNTTAKNNVVAAINELFTSVSDGKALVAGAITDRGVPTPANATFQQMASNVNDIPFARKGMIWGTAINDGRYYKTVVWTGIRYIAFAEGNPSYYRISSEEPSTPSSTSQVTWGSPIAMTGVGANSWIVDSIQAGGKTVVLLWGGGGSGGQVSFSTIGDGNGWTYGTAGESTGWGENRSITWGNNLYVAARNNSAGDITNPRSIITSPDAITWTVRSLPATTGGPSVETWGQVAFGNNMFICLSVDGTSGTGNIARRLMTSTNGTTWTWSTVQIPFATSYVIWDGKQFVAVGRDLTTNRASSMTSPNGTTWTVSPTPTQYSNIGFYHVSYANGMYMAVISFQNPGLLFTSKDGLQWNPRDLTGVTSNSRMMQTASGNKTSVLVGGRADTNGANIWYSYDRY